MRYSLTRVKLTALYKQLSRKASKLHCFTIRTKPTARSRGPQHLQPFRRKLPGRKTKEAGAESLHATNPQKREGRLALSVELYQISFASVSACCCPSDLIKGFLAACRRCATRSVDHAKILYTKTGQSTPKREAGRALRVTSLCNWLRG